MLLCVILIRGWHDAAVYKCILFLLNVGTQKDSVMHCIVVLSFRSVVYLIYFLSYHFFDHKIYNVFFFPRVVSGSSRIAF